MKKIKCEICGLEYVGTAFGNHVKRNHGMISKDYYDKYVKKETDGVCFFCGESTKFLGVGRGYEKKCKSKSCYKRSLATNSIEGIMYHQEVSEEDAIIIHKKQISKTVKSNKKTLKKQLKENPNFTKEKSINCVEYWLKRGYSEEDAKKESRKAMKNIHNSNSQRWKENNFDDVIPTQLGYWLKKGYSEIEAKKKLKERQQTFSKEICIEKYGEVEGLKRWEERQQKWQDNLKSKSPEEIERINRAKLHDYKGYSQISQRLFKSIYEQVDNDNEYYFAILKNKGVILDNGDCDEYCILVENTCRFLDFYDATQKKCVEFDGDYWHGVRPGNKERDAIREKEIINAIPDIQIMHVKECDYKNNPEQVVNECLEFLRS